MTARTGMANLILRMRSMCAAPTDDYVVNSVTYWSDDQLQDALDDHSLDIKHELLTTAYDLVGGGSIEYHDYYFSLEHVEEATSGSLAWQVKDSTGASVSTALYDVNYRAQNIRFTADTKGTAYFLDYRTYDLERAVADVWEQKAGHVWDAFDLSTDNHKMTRSQKYDHCISQAEIHRRRAPARVSRLRRSDANYPGGHQSTHFTPPRRVNISGGTAG